MIYCHGVRSAQSVMAYSPLGGSGSTLLRDPTLARIGATHACSPAAVALARTIRSGKVIAIPESGNVMHVRENAVALSLVLTSEKSRRGQPRRKGLESFYLCAKCDASSS
jgi:diketogulonate reductase-like aldo/keto reductase